jgi:Relaxase/Mobilisation nuclease domain
VIIKGDSVGGADRLATHLSRADTNERVEVKELRGVAAESLRGALREIEAVASGARTTKPFYHASINTEAHERLSDGQRTHAIDTLEAKLGLTGQPRVVVVHEKKEREHCHIVWSRIDLDRMAAISDSHNYRRHEEVARQLEREFGHARVQGAHVEREGRPRPERTPSHAEMLQSERTGLRPAEVKERVTELWRSTDSGQAFPVALWQNGFVLARGEGRDFVIIDERGGTHSLARRIGGATAKDVRARMADLDASRLPNIADAKLIQQRRQARDMTHSKEAAPEPRMEAARPAPEYGSSRSGTHEKPGAAGRIADGPTRIAGGLFEGLANAIERGLSGNEAQSDLKREEPEPEPDPRVVQHEASVEAQQEDKKKTREALLREFGREIPHEHEAEIERGRERDRKSDEERGRSR